MKFMFFIKIVFIFFIINLSSTIAKAKLVDKILAVVNDEVITLSMVERIRSNLSTRRNIAPMLYNESSPSNKDIIQKFINKNIVRAKLEEQGHIIDDNTVEGEIKANEKRLKSTRKDLLMFLRANKITFEEYFELMRELIEFSIFHSKVIHPLITITEQQIKNDFYKENSNNKALTFKYTLVDFYIHKKHMNKKMLKNVRNVLKKFQTSGVLPDSYRRLETNPLGELTEDGLFPKLKTVLKKTDEGTFTKPLLIGTDYHIFFVKEKSLVESSMFLNSRPRIKAKLFEIASKNMVELWFQREQNKHYIKYFN